METGAEAFRVDRELEVHPAARIMPLMEEEEYLKFREDISGNGLLEPLVLYQGKILDGIHRYRACKELGIDAWARTWEGGMNPVEYVVSKNLHRRHLTVGQKAMVAANTIEYHREAAKQRQIDAGKEHGRGSEKVWENLPRPIGEAQRAEARRARDEAGRMVGISGRSVEKAVAVLEHGTKEERVAVAGGSMSLNAAAEKALERKKSKPKPRPTFNETTDSIKWARWTWNPVTGCNHGCRYCYARDFTERYPQAFPDGFRPSFHPDRLDAPGNSRPIAGPGGNSVFVCSMGDMFGDWVKQEWIDLTLESCRKWPAWRYIFLTKNPERLCGVDWPANACVGTTVDCAARVAPAIEAFGKIARKKAGRPGATFVSCEPLNERVDFGKRGLDDFDWVIIGGRSRSSWMEAFQPEWEWVETLFAAARRCGCSVFWKKNLTVRPEEFPEMLGGADS